MTEQKLEKIAMDKISTALDAAGIESYQLIGAWQIANGEVLKAAEEGNAENIVTLKVLPRQYETPTIPYATFTVRVNVISRAEIDAQGTGWMAATETVKNLLQGWQAAFSAVQADFEIADEFKPSGFSLEGGDLGLDRDNCIWQFSQSFNLYGIIQ